MNAMTAAHPTLPLPSYVRVTNLKNGTSVIVRVNDRGPFAHDRVIDLSKEAARHLGILKGGLAAVELNLIVPEPTGTEMPAPVAGIAAGSDRCGCQGPPVVHGLSGRVAGLVVPGGLDQQPAGVLVTGLGDPTLDS